MVSFLLWSSASPQQLVHNSHRRGLQDTQRVVDHSGSHSQEVAELGSKPTLDLSRCTPCFLHSLIFPLVSLPLSVDSLPHKNPEEEGEEPITEVRAGG